MASPNSAHAVRSYHRQRAALIAALGGECCRCGEGRHSKLEFHHKRRRTWVARKKNRWVRIALYKREAAVGEIELLCRRCNKLAGTPPDTHTHTHTDSEIPE